MPISPDEAMKLNNDDLEMKEKLEKEIDDSLREMYTGARISIELSIPIPERIKEEIRSDYKKVGWKIVHFQMPNTIILDRNEYSGTSIYD